MASEIEKEKPVESTEKKTDTKKTGEKAAQESLNEKDLKMIATDRNAKEGLRLLAKKMLTKGKV